MLKRVSIAAAMMLTSSAAHASVQFVIYGAADSDRRAGSYYDFLQHYIVIHANDTEEGQSIPFSEFGQNGTYSFTSASLSISLGSLYSYNLTFRPIALDKSVIMLTQVWWLKATMRLVFRRPMQLWSYGTRRATWSLTMPTPTIIV